MRVFKKSYRKNNNNILTHFILWILLYQIILVWNITGLFHQVATTRGLETPNPCISKPLHEKVAWIVINQFCIVFLLSLDLPRLWLMNNLRLMALVVANANLWLCRENTWSIDHHSPVSNVVESHNFGKPKIWISQTWEKV